ncbi:hypothetical protein [Cytobacillus sp. IB215665]|uniref:hypothetical protein n=1 Tax=Cytobacillus sp. IB215665 TaxID=3097357 RepID=UPI002A14AD56|nr:hypothetical protein [Cytobacillus sp. IB215665]MDX8367834.1 hypothetical protein [Cytobacillus sp. IB215665]
MPNKFLELDKIITVWLDEEDDFGIVEMECSVLRNSFCPIERNEYFSKNKYSIKDYLWFPNYQGARRNIKPYITGRLSQRNIDILVKLDDKKS